MTRHELRDYQEACVAAHFSFFHRHEQGHPLFVIPTGGGKSLIIAEFVRRVLETWGDQRILNLAHVRELIDQNHAEFCGQWDSLFTPAGIFSAGMGRKETDGRVIFGGIQSVWNKARELGSFDLVLIDEAHMVPKRGAARYRHYLAELSKINPKLRVCGYTATHYRLDGGYLHKGDDALFTDVAYEVPLETLIEGGWLVPLIARQPQNVIDTAGVKRYQGDFKISELETKATGDGLVEAAVAEAVELARAADRKHWLFFAIGVKHAEQIVSELQNHGVEAAAVFGKTPKEERDRLVRDFKDGRLPCLVNVGVLTTGFNAPRCDLMAVLRPTQSASLYVQMMGRGMRTFPGKRDCLVLDYGENVRRHGPVNRVKPRHHRADGTEKEPPPTKLCPECSAIVMLGTRTCPGCGYEWPTATLTIEHGRVAAWEAPFDPEANKPRTWNVDAWWFRKHEKPDKPPSLRVDYICGMRTVTEWVCLEHTGFAGRKAARWWSKHKGGGPIPDTVDQAIERQHELAQPARIVVVAEGQYDRVAESEYDTEPNHGATT